jgi:hypothetical protein
MLANEYLKSFIDRCPARETASLKGRQPREAAILSSISSHFSLKEGESC